MPDDQNNDTARIVALERTAASLEATSKTHNEQLSSLARSVESLRQTVADGFTRMQARGQLNPSTLIAGCGLFIGVAGAAAALIMAVIGPIKQNLDSLETGVQQELRRERDQDIAQAVTNGKMEERVEWVRWWVGVTQENRFTSENGELLQSLFQNHTHAEHGAPTTSVP